MSDDFFEAEWKRLESQERFFVAPVGETPMKVKYQEPRNTETKYGPRKVFKIVVYGKETVIPFDDRLQVYQDLIQILRKTKHDTNVILTRTGTGKSTRYTIREA